MQKVTLDLAELVNANELELAETSAYACWAAHFTIPSGPGLHLCRLWAQPSEARTRTEPPGGSRTEEAGRKEGWEERRHCAQGRVHWGPGQSLPLTGYVTLVASLTSLVISFVMGVFEV